MITVFIFLPGAESSRIPATVSQGSAFFFLTKKMKIFITWPFYCDPRSSGGAAMDVVLVGGMGGLCMLRECFNGLCELVFGASN
jgi:hypothetical protein